jgi:hypothetical protein
MSNGTGSPSDPQKQAGHLKAIRWGLAVALVLVGMGALVLGWQSCDEGLPR